MDKKLAVELKKRKYGLLAAGLAALIAFLIFVASGRLFGEYSFLVSDLRAQYVHFIKLFWRSLLGEGSLNYTFEVGMGTPAIPLFAYYCLSPFNVIYLLISDVAAASAVVVILKFALAAYTFWWFEKRILKQDSVASAAFAACYALSGYSIAFFYNIINTDGLYMLPVIVTLVIMYVRTGSWRRLLLAYAYQFVVMFYSGYIIGIFSFLILLLAMVWEYGKDYKKYVTGLLKFAGIVVWAALLGAAVLLPTARYLLSNSIDSASSFAELRLTVLDIYNNLFLAEFQSDNVIFPLIYSGLTVLLLVPVYFLKRRVGIKEKILFAVPIIFLLACSLWMPLYILMHGFNAPNLFGFRFSYFYSFILLAAACRGWELSKETRVWKFYALAAVNIVLYYVIYLLQKNTLERNIQSSNILGLEINAFFLILYAFLLSCRNKGKDRKHYLSRILLICVCVELFTNGYLYGSMEGNLIVNHKYSIQLMDQLVEEGLDWIAQDELAQGGRKGFRIQCTDLDSPATSASFGYRGLGYFSTVENRRLRNVLFRLGYFSGTNFCADYGGTAVTRMLFSQDYLISYYQDQQEMAVSVERNEECLSLGFMVSERIKEYQIKSEDPFENQNLLLQSMLGEDILCFLPYEGEFTVQADNMYIMRNEEYDKYLLGMSDTELDDGSLVFEGEAESELPLYAYFSQDEGIRNNDSPKLFSGERGAPGWLVLDILSCPRVFALEKNETGRYEAEIVVDNNTVKDYFFNHIYCCYYDEGQLQEAYGILSGHQMEITSIRGDAIEAEVAVDDDRTVLFTSIPYDDAWKVKVDGKIAETFSVLDGTFLAVELMPGVHKIEISYQSRVNTAAAWVSAAACIAFLLAAIPVFPQIRKIKMSKKKEI